jgi:hypothetical protein
MAESYLQQSEDLVRLKRRDCVSRMVHSTRIVSLEPGGWKQKLFFRNILLTTTGRQAAELRRCPKKPLSHFSQQGVVTTVHFPEE